MSIEHNPQPTGTSKHPLEHGLDAPVAIPPVGERHEDYFPKKRNIMRRVIGGTAAAAILIGGGLAAKSALGGEGTANAENPAPTPDTTASAPATPGETNTAPVALSPIEAIGTEQTDYDTLNVQPSKADVERALQPLSVDKYTPEEAVIEFGKKLNVYKLGGIINNEDGYNLETVDSGIEGNDLLKAIFDSSVINGSELDEFRSIRTMVANRFNYFTIGYTPESLIDKTTGEKASATLNESWGNLEADPSEMTFTVNRNWVTNFEKLDRDDVFDNPGIDESNIGVSKVTLTTVDGEYKIKSLVSE